MTSNISRRDVLKSLAMSAAATSVLRVIPAQAAEHAHRMIAAEKAATKTYAPKFFSAHDYKTLQGLCETIIPA
ncbi:MAG TPA: twin-arginine translocation signal domain-containing protein, partial [Terriglobales bacterium]|nr:twin-arginine translocation signal domain-containing protein [Terriglobales bacterium]